MADTVDITAGAGTTIATDDVGGTHYQEIKLVNGTKDSATPVAVDVGAKANALRVAPANDITDATYIGDIRFGEAEPNSAAILSDTTDIKTSVELIDNAVDGNYLNTNMNIAGTDVSANAGVLTAQTQRVTIATDDEVNNLLTTIDADTSTIAGDTTSIDGKITACNTGAVVLAAGANSIGTLGANSGVDIGDVDVTSIIPGVGATNLGKAEDAAHSTGDTGVMALAVRFDAGGALSGADGDYSPIQVDANGAVRVTGGGGGTEYTEDVATANPIVGSAIMFERDDVLGGLTPIEGDWASMRCSAEGALWVQDFNSDAILADTNTIAGDTTSIDGKITACNTGAVVLAAGGNSIGTLGANDGVDIGDVTVNNAGSGSAVNIQDGSNSITVDTDGGGLEVLQDTAADLNCTEASAAAIKTAVEKMDDWDAIHASAVGTDGCLVMGAAYSTGLPTDVGADADAARLCTDRYGRMLPGIMPQKFNAVYDSSDATAEGETVKAATAARKIYILSCVISSDVEGWIKLQDEDSNALTGKLWLKAGGGMALTFPDSSPLVLDTVNKALEVIAEAAGDVSVTVTGYLAP